MTTDSALTSEQILSAAEDVLRRFGPAKATVVDIARALGVSHGSVYRHFPSKAALREAVTQRWLDQAHDRLQAVTAETGPAAERMHRFLATLFAAKRKKALDDPELFATYLVLVDEHSDTVAAHLDTLVGQLARILEDGVRQGEFAATAVPPRRARCSRRRRTSTTRRTPPSGPTRLARRPTSRQSGRCSRQA